MEGFGLVLDLLGVCDTDDGSLGGFVELLAEEELFGAGEVAGSGGGILEGVESHGNGCNYLAG